MNVLITGGAGYVGSQTCRLLAEAGFKPIVLDDLSAGFEENVRWGPLYKGDIRDNELVRHILIKEDIKSVFHFAALVQVGESMMIPLKYYDNNVTASIDFVSEAVQNNVQNFIFSSSCSVYGEPSDLPVREDHFAKPISVYGSTKLTIENLLKNLSHSYPLRCISLRYFNAAGSSNELGEKSSPPIHIIPLAIKAALDPNYTLHVYGNTYATPDGSCIRDFVHVEDVARAHVLALQKLLSLREMKYNNCYNLGAGIGYSVFDIINKVESVTGKTVKYSISSPRTGDPSHLVASFEKAKRELGWSPEKSDLVTIVRSAYDWQQKF